MPNVYHPITHTNNTLYYYYTLQFIQARRIVTLCYRELRFDKVLLNNYDTIYMDKLSVKTHSRTEFIDITSEVNRMVRNQEVKEGICYIYVPHTTAAVTINENADPSVQKDIIQELDKIVPWNGHYSHMEGNSAAHIKSTLVGSSVSIPISNGELTLGTWQGIYFCEFDGPRNREAFVQIVKGM